MRKIRVHSPGVSNGRPYLGSGGGQLTCAMQDERHALFKYFTSFSLWSTFLLILPLSSYPDLTLSYAVGDLVTRLALPSHSLTHSLNYVWIPFVLSQLKLHCSCLKPLVLSNVVQGGSLSASFHGYNCSLRIRPWWANLCGPQSYSQWPSSYLHLPFLPSKYWTLPTEVTFVWLIRFCV